MLHRNLAARGTHRVLTLRVELENPSVPGNPVAAGDSRTRILL